MRGMIAVEVSRCLGCRTCQLACATAHSEAQTLSGAIAEGEKPRIAIVSAGRMAVPLQCRHCEDAPCVAICPTGALQKLEAQGPVITNPDLCIGCKSCMLVCPFGVIRLGPRGKAITKCDLCLERLQAGQLPACVAACPTHALTFVQLDQMLAALQQQAAEEARRALQAAQAVTAAQRPDTPDNEGK